VRAAIAERVEVNPPVSPSVEVLRRRRHPVILVDVPDGFLTGRVLDRSGT